MHHQQIGLVGNQRLFLHNVLQAVVSVGPAGMHRQRRWLGNGYYLVGFPNQQDFAEYRRLVSGKVGYNIRCAKISESHRGK